MANAPTGTITYPTPELRAKWEHVVRWFPAVRKAQDKVFSEDGRYVPAVTIFAHMQIESRGEPDAVNFQGAYGLMQLTPNAGIDIDWDRVLEPEYNVYLGAKTLSAKYQHCGGSDWVQASRAYFSGSCTLNNTTDTSNGYTDAMYERDHRMNVQELAQLGINDTSTPNTGELASHGACIAVCAKRYEWWEVAQYELCRQKCLAETAVSAASGVLSWIPQTVTNVVAGLAGIAVLGIGLWFVARD